MKLLNSIVNIIKSILLFALSVLLFCILAPFGLLWSVVTSIKYLKWFEFFDYISNIFFSVAFSIDQIGNVLLSPFMNRWFINKNSKYHFGSIKHTISLVIAYNYKNGTLTTQGLIFYFILESAQSGHCDKAIESFENTQFKDNKNLI